MGHASRTGPPPKPATLRVVKFGSAITLLFGMSLTGAVLHAGCRRVAPNGDPDARSPEAGETRGGCVNDLRYRLSVRLKRGDGSPICFGMVTAVSEDYVERLQLSDCVFLGSA